MNLLEHREFGSGLQWLKVGDQTFQPNHPSTEIKCWLEYWVYLHTEIKKNKHSRIFFVNFDALKSNPSNNIKSILYLCGISADCDRLIQMITSKEDGVCILDRFKNDVTANFAINLKNRLLDSEKRFNK
jgi:hypothetical protein